jgi:hypothetical protein
LAFTNWSNSITLDVQIHSYSPTLLLGFLILQFLFQFAIGFSKTVPLLGFTIMNNNCVLKDRDAEVGVGGSGATVAVVVVVVVVVAVVCTSQSDVIFFFLFG